MTPSCGAGSSSLRDKVKNQNTSLRVNALQQNRRPDVTATRTVLPSNPASVLLAKSNHSNSLQAFYLPGGGLKLCCQLKKNVPLVTASPPWEEDGKRPVCRTGTLKFQGKSNEVMPSTPSRAQGSSRRRQCYRPSCKAREDDAGPRGPTGRCSGRRCPQPTPT